MAAAVENQAPVVVTAAGDPRIYTKQLQASGIRVIHVASCVDLAMRAEDAGVDAIIAEGFESERLSHARQPLSGRLSTAILLCSRNGSCAGLLKSKSSVKSFLRIGGEMKIVCLPAARGLD